MKSLKDSIKKKALALLVLMMIDILMPLTTFGLTGGPSQPEVESFEPVGTSEMVDLFSGDFNYNIPLLDVNGYPVNIAYHAGVSADQEASWVGLGWNINPGTVNRSLRGLPDDMNGEQVQKELNIKPNWTFGINAYPDLEFFGLEQGVGNKAIKKVTENSEVNLNFGMKFNSYKGISTRIGGTYSWKQAEESGFNAGLSLDYSEDGGIDLQPSVGIHGLVDEWDPNLQESFRIGNSFNSRQGLKSMNLSYSFSEKLHNPSGKLIGDPSGRSGSIGLSAMYDFSSKTYTPGISTPFTNLNIDFRFKTGPEIIGTNLNFDIGGYYSNQWIKDDDKKALKKGFGYLYEQESHQSANKQSRDYLLDFNRSASSPLMEGTPYLPWSNHSYDMYGVSAQGVGGTYRLFRNDIPLLHDDVQEMRSSGFRGGIELGYGNAAKSSVNFGVNFNSSSSGCWTEGNKLLPLVGFKKKNSDKPNYEPAYFRQIGELVPQSEEYLQLVGRENNYRPVVSSTERSSRLGRFLVTSDQTAPPLEMSEVATDNIAQERTPRNKLLSYLTNGEDEFCLMESIEYLGINDTMIGGSFDFQTIDRQSRNNSHISEVTVLNDDGSRHVFGIPAYNNLQVEKSFRVEEPLWSDQLKGLVTYDSTSANSKRNKEGIDHYYSSTTTPAYVHSYLLTGVLSPDYIDVTGNGISDDDLGSAVKFNYFRAHSAYRWRTPIDAGKAKHSSGLKSDHTDDMGNYIYGEKEMWYLHSIEGKTHIALFKLSQRNDALGVKSENGGASSAMRSYKLDRIELFSKRELQEFGASAIPVKSVHFEYDYSLCPGVSNQVNLGQGKLTLKKIYFTYGKSEKGKLHAYKFHYNESFSNVSGEYDLLTYDRWGTYTPGRIAPSNAEFPYTIQNRDSANVYASLWNLKQVQLPSGGVINIGYESDQYGYVQDKQAMNMYSLVNFGRKKDGEFIRENSLFSLFGTRQNDYIFFDLDTVLPQNDLGKEILRKEYLKGLDQLQVTVLTDINNEQSKYEYIKTYIEPDYVQEDGKWKIDCGLTDNGQTGWIRMNLVDLRDRKKSKVVNPIARAAWQYASMHLNHLIYPSSNRMKSDAFEEIENIAMLDISFLVGMFADVSSMVQGKNRMLMQRNFCRRVNPNQSWIRLNNRNKRKLGGGHRVRSIILSDNWDDMNQQDPDALESFYGQVYTYTTSEQSESGFYSEISSGVASYEPNIGNDENPFVRADFYDQKTKGVPDTRYTFEHPLCSDLMPGPTVGYSKVTVRSINHFGQNPQHRTGYQVTEFYTARDYPTQVYSTEIQNVIIEPPKFQFDLFYGDKYESATAAQGYTVILNDMHGKPKANWSYDENDNRLSGVEYAYKMDEYGALDNTVLAIEPDGTIDQKTFGVNIDFAIDTRQMKDEFWSASGDFNLDVFAFGLLPIFVPTLFPSAKISQSRVSTAIATKVVRKIGLLQTTTAYKEGSEIKTENLLYDGQTGQVLLTSVQNEFEENIYSFTYPAHWAYDPGMGQAFKNWGLELTNLDFHNGNLISSDGTDLESFLVPGDECVFYRPGRGEKHVWVNRDMSDSLVLIDSEGVLVHDNLGSAATNQNTSLRIIRSGRRNMASVSVGSVVSRNNPLVLIGQDYMLDFTQVISTSAVEYKDEWRTDLTLFSRFVCDTVVLDLFSRTLNLIDEIIPDSAFFNEYHYKGHSICAESYYDSTTLASYSSWSDLVEDLYSSVSLVPEAVLLSGLPEPHTTSYSYNEQLTIDTTTNEDSIIAICAEYENSYIYNNPPYWFCHHLDTIGVWLNCQINYQQKILRGVHFSPDSESRLTPLVPTFELDLSDTAFVYDSISVQYYPVADNLLFKNYPDKVYIRTRQGKTFEELSPSYEIVDSFYQASDLYATDTCSPVVIDTPQVVIYPLKSSNYLDKDGYKIDITSKCDMSCSIEIDNQGVPVKDILQILAWEMNSSNSALIRAEILSHFNVVDTVNLVLSTSCGDFFECVETCETQERGWQVNPYLTGLKGNWRPHRSWTYLDDRNYDVQNANPQRDGTFDLNTFWNYNDTTDSYQAYPSNNWVWTSEVTEYSPFGMELENIDPLGRYSAAMYSFSQTLPVAVASNTRHRELWYEGFEQYQYLYTLKDNFLCDQDYYVNDDSLHVMVEHNGLLDQQISHTGNVSLKLSTTDSFFHEIALSPDFVEPVNTGFSGKVYFTSEADQTIHFRPEQGVYVLGAWVRQANSPTDTTYTSPYIKVEIEDSLAGMSVHTLRPSGQIIDGWQRIQETFQVSSDPEVLRIKYMTSGQEAWFDDLRIFPYHGNMKSYAYDFRTLRLMAELDENNYATFYEYDLEGNLVRIKKETIRGIQTLQENRQHQVGTNK